MKPPNANGRVVLLYIGIFFSMFSVGLFLYSKEFRWAVLCAYVPLLLLGLCLRAIPRWFTRKWRQMETLPHDALLFTTAHHSTPNRQRGRYDTLTLR